VAWAGGRAAGTPATRVFCWRGRACWRASSLTCARARARGKQVKTKQGVIRDNLTMIKVVPLPGNKLLEFQPSQSGMRTNIIDPSWNFKVKRRSSRQ
jgi:hypothetical protein